MKHILALIVDYNSTEEARKLSLQLASQKNLKARLTIVHIDNRSSSPVVLSSEQKAAGVVLFRASRNDGYAGGIVAAIQGVESGEVTSKGSDAYWFLNSDLEIADDTLAQLESVLDENPKAAAVGPTVYKGLSRNKIWGVRGQISPTLGMTRMSAWAKRSALPKWSYIPGSTLLIRKTAYDEVGGFNQRYRMYYEETELCVKLQKAGWQLWVEPKAEAFHLVYSMKSGVPSRHFTYYFVRNNLAFWKNCFGIPAAVQLPRLLFVVSKEVLLPLRRSKDSAEVIDRIKYLSAALADAPRFSRHAKGPGRYHTKREKELFEIT